MISKQNYEAFFLDYHEGNLGEELKQEVLAFVASHPELREEFESFEVVSLSAKPVHFSGKLQLKKDVITEFNYKTWLVAYHENDLNVQDRQEVEQFIEKKSGHKQELEHLKLTEILPDLSIRFTNKSSLKKGGTVIPLWVRVAAAACLLIGLLSYFVLQQKPAREIGKSDLPENPASVPVKKQVIEEIKVLTETLKENGMKDSSPNHIQNQKRKKVIEIKTGDQLASKDSIHPMPQENIVIDQPVADKSKSETTIKINEKLNKDALPSQKLVVLDDNDLAELGLKENPKEENKSLLADAVNGVGKIFRVNAHYAKEQNSLQTKYTETLALGPLAITRTVSR